MTDAEKLEALRAMLDQWVKDYEYCDGAIALELGCCIFTVRRILDE